MVDLGNPCNGLASSYIEVTETCEFFLHIILCSGKSCGGGKRFSHDVEDVMYSMQSDVEDRQVIVKEKIFQILSEFF